MNKALRTEHDWDVAVSKAVTNRLRHDHHAEVTAHGFMDTGGWVKVKDIVAIPSIYAWDLDEADVRAVVMKQGKKKVRLEYDCNGYKIRSIQGFGSTVGGNVDWSKIFEKVDKHNHYVKMLYHGTKIEYVSSLCMDGIDRRFSKCGTRVHVHLTDQYEAVKQGKKVAGVRDGSTAVVGAP